VTQPTPGQPESSGSADSPPLTGPLPTGPAYPGPPPPGYSPAPSPAPPDIEAPLKSRLTAGLLGIFLGAFGVHRFYLGYTSMGVLQVLVTIATCGIGGFWGFVEGILILNGKAITTDADGRPLRP
jgi:TM2 domain-containing membrane protein YozV